MARKSVSNAIVFYTLVTYVVALTVLIHTLSNRWYDLPEAGERLNGDEDEGDYIVERNYLKAALVVNFNESVTLATQGTPEYLHHSVNLCKRWEGPISLAVYAPGDDFYYALQIIQYLRECEHPCVKQSITWHMIYESDHPLSIASLFPATDLLQLNCSTAERLWGNHQNVKTFRKRHKRGYPINVARNVARVESSTEYILSLDIELYPSLGIVSKLMKFLSKTKSPSEHKDKHQVYVLPAFEINEGQKPPETMQELSTLLEEKKAFFFHQNVCDTCFSFPNREGWIKDVHHQDLFVYDAVIRQHNNWEPFFVGTNRDPMYPQSLSREGQKNHQFHVYEMCLLNYTFNIMGNAFLVHSPGIKVRNMRKFKQIWPFYVRNRLSVIRLMEQLELLHGIREDCPLHLF